MDLSYTHVDDLRPLCLPCPNIVTLNLSSCMDLDPKSVITLIGRGSIGCQDELMEYAQGHGQCKENEEDEMEVEAMLPHLKHLDVSYCRSLLTSEYVPQLILHGGKRLLSLSINGCREVKDATWQSIFGSEKASPSPPLHCLALTTLSLKQCIGIKSLHLGPVGRFANLLSIRLALSSVERVKIKHHVLNDLDLNGCRKLSSLELVCPVMARISMQSCQLIRSLLLDCIAFCPRLESLDLKNCAEEVSVLVSEVVKGGGLDLLLAEEGGSSLWDNRRGGPSSCDFIQGLLKRVTTLIL